MPTPFAIGRRSIALAALFAAPALAANESPFGNETLIRFKDNSSSYQYATTVTDINERGDLCGYGRRENGVGAPTDYAFLYTADDRAYKTLASGRAYGLNDAREVVGQADSNSYSMNLGAFVARPGADVEYLGESREMGMAHDVNNNGWVVGRAGPEMDLAAYNARTGAFAILGRPADAYTYPQRWQDDRTAINDRNVAVTSVFRGTGYDSQAAIRKPIAPPPGVGYGEGTGYDGSFSYLDGHGPASYSHAATINDAGLVGGQIDGDAAVWTPLGATKLGGPLGAPMHSGIVRDLNNLGVAVGQSRFDGKSKARGFLWRNGVAVDLNELIDVTSAFGSDARISDATGINDRGQIVTTVFINNFQQPQTYVYDPVAGASIFTPRMPDRVDAATGAHEFANVSGGQWFDPVAASGFSFDITSDGNGFAHLLELPPGFGAMTVLVDDEAVTLNAGDALDLHGARHFEVRWAAQAFESIGSIAFPIKLDFTTATASFRMTPILATVPEPTTLLTLAAIATTTTIVRRRRR